MDIKIPKGMKSPTVIIVSQGIMQGDEKYNKLHRKQMDLLEKRFNQRYKDLIDIIKGIKSKNNISRSNNGSLNKSFESFFARMEKLIKEVRPRMIPSPS